MEEKLALLEEYVRQFKERLDYFRDALPPDVQEAYEVMIRVAELVADPSVLDQNIREVIFEKVPRERIQWAMGVVDNWSTRDERRAEARKRERERRQRNGKMEERKLTEKTNQELYEKFDVHRILDAVDLLDEVRPVISDQFNEDGFPRPPEIREQLLRLHEKANDIIGGEFRHDTDKGMFDLAWEVEDEIYDVIEKLEKIQEAIGALTDLTPEDEYEEGEDE